MLLLVLGIYYIDGLIQYKNFINKFIQIYKILVHLLEE